MATLRQLPSGNWQVQVRRVGLLPVAKSFKGRNDAQAWARQLESGMDRGVYPDFLGQALPAPSVVDYLDPT